MADLSNEYDMTQQEDRYYFLKDLIEKSINDKLSSETMNELFQTLDKPYQELNKLKKKYNKLVEALQTLSEAQCEEILAELIIDAM